MGCSLKKRISEIRLRKRKNIFGNVIKKTYLCIVEFMDNLVCVVDNGFFGAAAYADTEHEMKLFKTPSDTRPKVWIRWDKVSQFAM